MPSVLWGDSLNGLSNRSRLPGKRARLEVLACASVIVGVALGPVPAAHADTGVAPELVYATDHGPSSGIVAVSAQSDSAITSITAHLYAADAPADAPEVATIDSFRQDSGTDHQGVWLASEAVHLADLGTYRIVVDLTDADGDTSHTESRNQFWYVRTIDLQDYQVSPMQPDYSHQNVSVSGRYTVLDPRTGETTAAVDKPVVIHTPEASELTVATDSEGKFAGSFTLTQEYGGLVSTWLQGVDNAYQVTDDGDNAYVTPATADTRMTLDSTELGVKEGQSATISGRAEVYTQGSWQPLTGARVDAVWQSDNGSAAARPVTDAQGHFSGKILMPRTGTVEVQSARGTYLKASPTAQVKVHVARKTSISDFSASLNKYSQLTAKGRLHTGSSTPGDADNRVQLQYSADGTTGWTTLKTVTPGSGDPEAGAPFKGTFDAPYKGYYRAYFKGSAEWQPSYSPVLYVKRTKTRIIDGNASPEPVAKGRTITVKGKLQKYTSSAWHAYGSQTVKVLFRPKGSTTWYDMGNTTTRSDGTFSRGYTAQRDGTWVAELLYPDSTHLASAGREDYVDVT